MDEDTYPTLGRGVNFDEMLLVLRQNVSEIVSLRKITTDILDQERPLTLPEAIEMLSLELKTASSEPLHYAANIVSWRKKDYLGESTVITNLASFGEAARDVFAEGLQQLRTIQALQNAGQQKSGLPSQATSSKF